MKYILVEIGEKWSGYREFIEVPKGMSETEALKFFETSRKYFPENRRDGNRALVICENLRCLVTGIPYEIEPLANYIYIHLCLMPDWKKKQLYVKWGYPKLPLTNPDSKRYTVLEKERLAKKGR